jgi:2-keto-4-pentenoate hydratase/2-oxohepta-3-ene-1,7-dioic acid hydratase in catechol pathway
MSGAVTSALRKGTETVQIIRFERQGKVALGLRTRDGIRALDASPGGADLAALLRHDRRKALAQTVPSGEFIALDAVTILPPLADGARIFCIGLNYKTHVAETGRDMPADPSVFLRMPESLVAHAAALQRPTVSDNFDFEGELTVVIGEPARNIDEAHALDIVAGYTCFNDGSIRDYQKHSVTAGKNFEASGAVGPWIVTVEDIPDPTRLTLVTRLNGAEVQRSGTDMLIYPIPKLISYLSQVTTLQPGDIIATGTPAGVGARRTPPLWMKPGDVVEVDISGIGILRNSIAQAE